MVNSPVRDQSRLLLQAEQSRSHPPHTRITVLGASCGVANLFFCSYFERFLSSPPHARPFLLFLGVQSVLLWGFTCASYFGGQRRILRNTRIFPLARGARFHFLLSSTMRKPLVIALWTTGAFSVGVLFGESFPARFAATMLHILLALNVVLLTSTAFLIGEHFRVPAGAVTIISVGSGMLLLLCLVLFSSDLMLDMLPLVSWASNGIVAAVAEAWHLVIINVLLLTGSAVLMSIVGRRYD
jgi:hypothetical protein